MPFVLDSHSSFLAIARLAEHETTMRAAAKASLVDDLAGELEGRSDLTIRALVPP